MKVIGMTNCMVQKSFCESDADVSISVTSQL